MKKCFPKQLTNLELKTKSSQKLKPGGGVGWILGVLGVAVMCVGSGWRWCVVLGCLSGGSVCEFFGEGSCLLYFFVSQFFECLLILSVFHFF